MTRIGFWYQVVCCSRSGKTDAFVPPNSFLTTAFFWRYCVCIIYLYHMLTMVLYILSNQTFVMFCEKKNRELNWHRDDYYCFISFCAIHTAPCCSKQSKQFLLVVVCSGHHPVAGRNEVALDVRPKGLSVGLASGALSHVSDDMGPPREISSLEKLRDVQQIRSDRNIGQRESTLDQELLLRQELVEDVYSLVGLLQAGIVSVECVMAWRESDRYLFLRGFRKK